MTTSQPQQELHVVLGASGGIGGAVTRELARQGRRVRAVNRKGAGEALPGVEWVAGDVSRLDDARRVCQGASVVYFCVNPAYNKWAQDFPPLLAGAIEGASAADATFVFADNLYMYPPASKPLTEDMPWEPVTRKGAVRKAMDETLLAAHRSGRLRAVIGRAADYYGPHAPATVIGDRFFGQVLAGKKVEWMVNPDQPHTLSYTPDIARGLMLLGAREAAAGQAWHLPVAPALTGREYIQLVCEEAGVPARVTVVSPLMMRALGLFVPEAGETAEMAYEYKEPFLVDASTFTRAFGAHALIPTLHREALRATLAAYRADAEQAAKTA